jgi:hypothetical protein
LERGKSFQKHPIFKWEDVDIRRGLLTVRAAYAKSGDARAVNLNSILKAALKQLKEK